PHSLTLRARGASPSVPSGYITWAAVAVSVDRYRGCRATVANGAWLAGFQVRSRGRQKPGAAGRPVRHDLVMASPHPRAEPCRAALDIETLGDLALRLGTARLAPGAGHTWERGVPGDWLAGAINDWRAFDPLILQARLDRLSHLRTEVGGVAVHLVHA